MKEKERKGKEDGLEATFYLLAHTSYPAYVRDQLRH